METRKIQMTGGSSYIVTLPKDWIVSNGLRKNDPVNISQQGDGSLTIVSSSRPTVELHTVKRIEVDDAIDKDFLFRLLLGSYMAGYGVIEAYSQDGLSSNNIDIIEKFVQTTIGLEIIEGRDDCIVIKDLVDPSEMKLSKGLERMRSLVRNMLTDTFLAIQMNDIDKFRAVIARDTEVDRLEWMITRQTNMFQTDISVAKKMGHTQTEVTGIYTLCRIIERIGDHATIISKNCGRLIEVGSINEKMRAEISNLGEKITKLFIMSLNIFTSRSLIEANDCIEETLKAVTLCKEINKYAAEVTGDSVIAINLIAGSLRRVSEYSTDIAELAINDIISH